MSLEVTLSKSKDPAIKNTALMVNTAQTRRAGKARAMDELV